jgi:ComF family protein
MNVLESVIGWLAPPVCISCSSEGETLCAGCAMAGIMPYGERCFNCSALSINSRTCDKCRHGGSPRHVWVTTDYDNLAKNLVLKYKFGQQRAAAQSIAGLMIDTFLSFNSDEDITKADYLVVPVPTASSRVRQRGFDHSALLARAISNKLGLQKNSVLRRIGQSRQVGLSRSERIKQASTQYDIAKPQIIDGRNILLVDDVLTTGATISAVAKLLRKAGARRVDALVFAKKL